MVKTLADQDKGGILKKVGRLALFALLILGLLSSVAYVVSTAIVRRTNEPQNLIQAFLEREYTGKFSFSHEHANEETGEMSYFFTADTNPDVVIETKINSSVADVNFEQKHDIESNCYISNNLKASIRAYVISDVLKEQPLDGIKKNDRNNAAEIINLMLLVNTEYYKFGIEAVSDACAIKVDVSYRGTTEKVSFYKMDEDSIMDILDEFRMSCIKGKAASAASGE